MSSEPLLEVHGLSVMRQGRMLLDQVSLTLHAQERLALVGPNGAGKTTLLKCLTYIINDWAGDVTLEGRDLKSYPHQQRARCLAYVPQQAGHTHLFTVEDFVKQSRYPYQGFWTGFTSEDREAVEQALTLTDTQAYRTRLLAHLSGGERQRVLLAAALAQDTRILLLDEPTVFLDPKHESAFWTILSRVHEERRVALITVTHDLNQAVLRHDTILALQQGKVAFQGRPDLFMNRARLSDLYDSSFLLTPHPTMEIPMILPEMTL